MLPSCFDFAMQTYPKSNEKLQMIAEAQENVPMDTLSSTLIPCI